MEPKKMFQCVENFRHESDRNVYCVGNICRWYTSCLWQQWNQQTRHWNLWCKDHVMVLRLLNEILILHLTGEFVKSDTATQCFMRSVLHPNALVFTSWCLWPWLGCNIPWWAICTKWKSLQIMCFVEASTLNSWLYAGLDRRSTWQSWP